MRDTIENTGFVADAMISVKVVRNFTVIPRDMNGLVVIPDERLIRVVSAERFASVGPSVWVCPL